VSKGHNGFRGSISNYCKRNRSITSGELLEKLENDGLAITKNNLDVYLKIFVGMNILNEIRPDEYRLTK